MSDTKRRGCGVVPLLVLAGVVAAGVGCWFVMNPPPPGPHPGLSYEAGTAATATAGELSLRLRPLVVDGHGSDPVRVVLDLGPPAVWFQRNQTYRVTETVKTLRLQLTGPDGTPREHPVAIDVGQGLPDVTSMANSALVLRADVTLAPGDYTARLTGRVLLEGAAPIAIAVGPVPIRRHARRVWPGDAHASARAELRRFPTVQGHEAELWPWVVQSEAGLVFRGRGPGEAAFSNRLYTIVVSREGHVVSSGMVEEFSCLSVGTPVDTPDGPRPIGGLRPGDTVWSHDGADRVAATVRGHRTSVAPTIAVGGLRVTRDHPVWIDGAWRPAGSLRGGETLRGLDGLRAAPAPRAAGWSTVVDIEVDGPRAYFAAGVLVHNKSVAVGPSSLTLYDLLWRTDR